MVSKVPDNGVSTFLISATYSSVSSTKSFQYQYII